MPENEPKKQNPPVDYLHIMIEGYLKVRDKRQEHEKMVKEMKKAEQELEQVLWTEMEARGFRSISVEGIGLITRTFRANPYIVNFGIFRRWCRDSENMELLREEAKKQALRDFINDRLKSDIPDAIPPGIDWQVDKIISIKGREKDIETQEE